jgi:hypothetical protein
MHIAGHVGFTIGFFTLLNKNRNLTYKTCLIIAVVALLPDILDSGIHMMISMYPTHGVFHSIFFYAVSLPVVLLVFKRTFIYLTVMIINVMFDIVNVDLRAFMYPIYGWSEGYSGHPLQSPVESFLDYWPKTIGYKLPEGHYLLFEIIGMLIIVVSLRKLIVHRLITP